MLYCPRCKAKYEKGTQRFCTNDGVRLLPDLSGQQTGKADTAVFTRILGKTASASDEEQTGTEFSRDDSGAFQPPGTSNFFSERKNDDIVEDLFEEDAGIKKEVFPETGPAGRSTFEPIPIARLIDPFKIPEKRPTADLETTGRRTASISKTGSQAGELSAADGLELDIDQFSGAGSQSDAGPADGVQIEAPEFDEPPLEIGFGEPDEPDEDLLGEIRLDLDEPVAAESADFELEIGEVAGSLSSVRTDLPIELDLEHSAESVLPEFALPAIELDLEGIDFKGESETVSEFGELKKAPRMVNPADIEGGIKVTPDPAWEKRSDGGDLEIASKWYLPAIAALVILALGVFGLMYLMKPRKTAEVPAANALANQQNVAVLQNVPNVQSQGPVGTGPSLIDEPPPPRLVNQPPNTVFFKNELKTGLPAKEFLGFSVYFPKDWKANKSGNNYLDISKTAPDGIPLEQFLVSRYDSSGTYAEDLAVFDQLVEKSNKDLKNILANYQVIRKGQTEIQDGRWKAYEVKFQGVVSGKKLILWGRRLWIPVERKGMTSGFIITMIATSMAGNIHSVEDIGLSGDLATILSTFEPDVK